MTTSDSQSAGAVVPLRTDHTESVVTVFCKAFHDYPVMRYVLGPHGDYDARLRHLLHLFVMGRVHRSEPWFGIFSGSGLIAAATVSYPDAGPSPEAFRALQEQTWGELGPEALARYDEYASVWNGFLPEVPHAHLNMIGTLDSARGQGLGRLLMNRVHQLSLDTPGSEGVSLTTEDPRNVPMYEHVGYEVIAHQRIAPELETWGMYREDGDG